MSESNPAMTAAIRTAAAGLGAAVAGPLGGALGSALAAVLGEPAEKLIGVYVERFGEEAGKKFIDNGADSLLTKLNKPAPDLQSACREALRLSLSQIRAQDFPSPADGLDDWFRNWETCLKASVPLRLDEIKPERLALDSPDRLLLHTMERLDSQGQAIEQHSTSIILKTRSIPEPLVIALSNRLPDRFRENFREVLVRPEFDRAWKQADLIFRDLLNNTLGRVDQRTSVLPKMAEDTTATRADLAELRRMLGELRPSSESRALLAPNDKGVHELSSPTKELKQENLRFSFADGTELQARPINSILQAYYQDLLSGRLKGFKFSSEQISIANDTIYQSLHQRLNSSEAVDERRLLRKLEQSLIDGLVIALNIAYLGEKQVHNAYQTCFWYGRAIRSWIINVLKRDALSESPEELAFGAVSLESPLFGDYVSVERFYGSKMIKLEYWHPQKEQAPSCSLFLPIDGFVGKWFYEHPLPPQPLIQHYDPNDHYNFVLPQMIMRHVLLGERLIEDWSGYMVGAA